MGQDILRNIPYFRNVVLKNTPGILENSKPNAQILMEAWVEGLREHAALGELTIGHKAVATPPSRETLDRLQATCDFVLVGTGDCGSCMAWTSASPAM